MEVHLKEFCYFNSSRVDNLSLSEKRLLTLTYNLTHDYKGNHFKGQKWAMTIWQQDPQNKSRY